MGRVEGNARISFIVFLRACAAVIVMLSHLWMMFWNGGVASTWPFLQTDIAPVGMKAINIIPYMSRLNLNAGSIGVAFFFLITGFLINPSFRKHNAGGFLLSKLLRLFPMYLIGFTITFGCIALYHHYYGMEFPYSFYDWFTQVTLLRHVLWLPSIDGISWTLFADVLFYLLITLLYLLKKNRGKGLLDAGAVLTVLSVVCAINMSNVLAGGYRQLYILMNILVLACFCMTYMLIGAVLYEHFSGRWDITRTVAGVACMYGSFVVCCLAYVPDARSFICSYGLSLIVFILCYALWLKGYEGIFGSRIICFFADISYSLFIVHGLNGYMLETVLYKAGVNNYINFFTTVTASILLAWVLHRFCEKPLAKKCRVLMNALLKYKEC